MKDVVVEQQMVQSPEHRGASTQEQKALAYAKKGILLALLSGLIFSLDGIMVEQAGGFDPFSRPELFLLVPLICAGLHDTCSAFVTTLLNWRSGQLPELGRSLFSKPGRPVVAGAVVGSVCGMGGYMAALQLAGPAYVLPITSLYPAVAAVLAIFVLKERIAPRTWIGLACCIVGAIVIAYTPPDGQRGDLFYIGLAFAALAALGWGTEGVMATSGMDFIEPEIALNIYYLISMLLYFLIIIPIAAFVILPAYGGLETFMGFFTGKGALYILLSGVFGALSYRCWYNAMNMTGVSRAMALNISYALWGIILSFFFTDTTITSTLIIGALVIFFGMFLVIGNPKDMLNLRNTN